MKIIAARGLVIENPLVFHLYDLQVGFPSPSLEAPAERYVYRKHGTTPPKAPEGRHVQQGALFLNLIDCGRELSIGSR